VGTFLSAKLEWSWPEGTHHAGLRRLYRDLLAARRRWPPLRDFTQRNAELLPNSAPPGVLRLIRRLANTAHALIAIFNLSRAEQLLPTDLPEGTVMLLSSESSDYGGSRAPQDSPPILLPFESRVYGPDRWQSP
jgi:hypothetical protein